MKGHRDLEIASGAALICAVASPAIPIEALSTLFALPLALFLPGYALTAAIFARHPIERMQRFLLYLGLSLVVLALGSLLLNYAPGGIGPVSWAALLTLVVLGACRAAALRRPQATGKAPLWPAVQMTASTAALLAAATLIAAGAIALAFTTPSATHAGGFTELWLLPPIPGKAPAVGGSRIGVTSQEQRSTAYELQIATGDRTRTIVRDFSLDPGETRVLRLLPVSPLSPTSKVHVVAKLFVRRNPGEVYRRVSGWMTDPGAKR